MNYSLKPSGTHVIKVCRNKTSYEEGLQIYRYPTNNCQLSSIASAIVLANSSYDIADIKSIFDQYLLMVGTDVKLFLYDIKQHSLEKFLEKMKQAGFKECVAAQNYTSTNKSLMASGILQYVRVKE